MHEITTSHRRGMTRSLALALALTIPVVHAQHLPGQALSPADKALVHSYTLTEATVAKAKAVERDAKAHHVDLKLFGSDSDNLSVDAAAAKLDARPGAHALLAAHDLSARELVLTSLATAGALMTLQLANTPYASKLDRSQVNSANVDFVRQHMADFKYSTGD
jgi:hypothetical protein